MDSFHCQEKRNIHGSPNMFFLLEKSKLETKLKIKKFSSENRVKAMVTEREIVSSQSSSNESQSTSTGVQEKWLFLIIYKIYTLLPPTRLPGNLTPVIFLFPILPVTSGILCKAMPMEVGLGHIAHHVILHHQAS